MTTTLTADPAGPAPPAGRLYRNVQGRLLGGVAGALADHLGVPRRAVRLAFVLLSFSAGLGVLLYGAFWIVLRTRAADAPDGPARSAVQYAVAVLAAATVLLINARTLPLGWLFLPSVLACFGAALLWRQASETDRERWRRLSTSSLSAGATDQLGWLRIVAGVTLVLTGAIFILARAGISAAGAALAAVLVTAGGIALITGPWWLRLMRELTTERRERIRNEERAEIAAHLHDSVLQTLALIQRNAHQPREVARLARGQERELRAKLYGVGVQNTYAIAVDVVVVGDHAIDSRLEALLAASREALVNAAKHSGVSSVSVYAEVTDGCAEVFVRDRGVGFDPARTDPSRQGIRGSIIGRLERQHGTATIRSSPGAGTEVQLRVELP